MLGSALSGRAPPGGPEGRLADRRVGPGGASFGSSAERESGMSGKTIEETAVGFAALGLDPRLVEALRTLGYEEPTPIQREAIPPLLEGRDLIGQAATGTGKTAAFALPMLHRLAELGDDRRSARGARPGADPRAGDAGRRGRPPLRPRAGHQGAAGLRRAGVRAAAPGPGAGRRRRGRHARPGPRSHPSRHAPARGTGRGRARRGRRDARHGVRR